MTRGRAQDKWREAAILMAGIAGPWKGRAMEGNSEEEPDWLSVHWSRRPMDWAGVTRAHVSSSLADTVGCC